MNIPLARFRAFLTALTLAMLVVTVMAAGRLGVPAGISTFLADLGHPWRAQYLSDLEAHLLLAGCWMIYRERSRPVGAGCAIAALLFGALFTIPYVLLASYRTLGDPDALLTGRKAARAQ
jgi:hypothetical protein